MLILQRLCLLLLPAATLLQPVFRQAVVCGRISNPKEGKKVKLLRADYERFDHAELGEFEVQPDGAFRVDIAKGEPAVHYPVYDRKYRAIPIEKGGKIDLKFDAGAEDSAYEAQGSPVVTKYL